MSRVRDQFESHIRLHGPKAFIVYKAVFSIPFHDPEELYRPQRDLIEDTAMELDIELYRLQEEVTSPSGRAKTAKCAKTRKLYRSLVRRASREEQFLADRAPALEESPTPSPSIGSGIALNNNTSFEDVEYLVDAEDELEPTPLAVGRPAATSNASAQLAFRVFDEYSGKQTSYTFLCHTCTNVAR